MKVVLILILILIIIIFYNNIEHFNSGGLSTINSIALYNTPINCFRSGSNTSTSLDDQVSCTTLGTVII